MPTSYTDQFYQMNPYAPPAAGTELVVQALTIVDSNNNGVLNATDNVRQGGTRIYDSINGSRITNVYNGDTVTVMKGGVEQTITGVTFYTADGNTYFSPLSADHLDNATFVSSSWVPNSTQATISSLGPPCFVAGTLILTPEGERAVEDLSPGDLVMTLDNGAQPLRWIGQRVVPARGRFAPIRFRRGALGNRRALMVSPQHRMVVGGWQAELLFGSAQVLVAAKHLVDDAAVRPVPMDQVTYVHLLFDRHEVIRAEGALTESFHPGAHILAGDAEMRAEIGALFPELDGAPAECLATARPVLKGREAVLLVA